MKISRIPLILYSWRYPLRRASIFICIFMAAFLFAMTSGATVSTDVSAEESAPSDQGQMTVVDFLDVGQGNATLIRFPDNKILLIDTGPKSSREQLLTYLDERDIDRIDVMVLTHQHGDHTDNTTAVLDAYPVGDIIIPDTPKSLFLNKEKYETLYKEIAQRGYALRSPMKGEVLLSGDDYSVTVLSDDTGKYLQLNDYSIVLSVKTGDVSFLFAADAESFVENQLLNSGLDLSSDVLQVGHHGNYAGTTTDFVAAVHPRISVISVGTNNFGQPSNGVIDRLDRSGSSVFRTNRFGTITVTTDGQRLFLDYGEI